MDEDRTKPTRLVEHDAALGSLLESLLAEVPAHPQTTAPTVTTDVPVPSLETASETTDHLALETPLNPADQAPLTINESVDNEARIPGWAREPFRALLFRIGDLRLAVPLILIRSVTRIPDRITEVPAQPAWHRGVTRYRDASVVIADLGLLMGLGTACPNPAYLLVIGDGREAIACDAVEEAVVIDAADVRWQRARDQQWLPGLLVDHMCGLLDAEAIGKIIRHE